MTLDTARLLANVATRAKHLFECGYRAVPAEACEVEVTNEEGTTYTVNTVFDICSCPFYEKHGGVYPCKHILGLPRLLEVQALAQSDWREVLGLPVTITGPADGPLCYRAPCLDLLSLPDGTVEVIRNDTGLPWGGGFADGDEPLRQKINAMIEEVTHG